MERVPLDRWLFLLSAAEIGASRGALWPYSERHVGLPSWPDEVCIEQCPGHLVLSKRLGHLQSAQEGTVGVEEILPHGFRSKTSLLRQVLREPELQLVEWAHRRLQMRNYVRFLQTFQQRPQRGRIPSLLAVSLCSVANESLDTFFGEAFHFYLALSH